MAHPQVVDPFNQPGAQAIRGLIADRNRDADRHATLACAAVARADQRVDGLVEVGVGHHDHVILRAAEALRALAVGRGARVDVLRDVGAADEAHRLDLRVLEDGVDGLLVAVHDLEHAWRQAGLEEQLGQPHRHRRVTLAGLRMNAFPHASAGPAFHSGIIAGKLNGRDARDHAQRLAHRIHVDA